MTCIIIISNSAHKSGPDIYFGSIGNDVHVLQEEETQSIIVLKLCLINGITNTPNKHSEHIVCYIVLVIHSSFSHNCFLLFQVSACMARSQ